MISILNASTNKIIPQHISKAENLALVNLKKDKGHITATADKGVSLVFNG